MVVENAGSEVVSEVVLDATVDEVAAADVVGAAAVVRAADELLAADDVAAESVDDVVPPTVPPVTIPLSFSAER